MLYLPFSAYVLITCVKFTCVKFTCDDNDASYVVD